MSLERVNFQSEQLFNHLRKGLFWGVLVSEDDQWYEIKLTRQISGPVNIPEAKIILVRKSFLLNHVYSEIFEI